MGLKKNNVSSPSNETKEKKSFLLVIIILICVAFFGTIGYVMYINIMDSSVEGSNKNAVVKNSVLVGKEFGVELSSANDKYFSAFVMKCPSGYKLRSDGKCTKATTSSKTFTFKYRGTTSGARVYASNKCKDNGYSSYKNFSYSQGFQSINVTCYGIIQKNVETSLSVRYYNQREIDGSVNSTCGGGSKKLSSGGCLPSATAMTFGTLKNSSSYSPTVINTKAKSLINNNKNKYSLTTNKYCKSSSNCYSSRGNQICSGSSYYVQLVDELAKEYGMNVYNVSDASVADKYLKTGKCMGIAALESGCYLKGCYSSRHFVAFFPNEKSGYAYLSDPWNRNYKAVETGVKSIINSTQSGYVKIVCKK